MLTHMKCFHLIEVKLKYRKVIFLKLIMFNEFEGRRTKRDPKQVYLLGMLTYEESIFKYKKQGENELLK